MMGGVSTNNSIYFSDNIRSDTDAGLFMASAAVFGQKGFIGTSLKDIAEMAGTEAGYISERFGSKTALICETLEYINRTESLFTSKADRLPDALYETLSKMKNGSRVIFSFISVLSRDIAIPQEVKALEKKLFEAGNICPAMKAAQEDGRLPEGDVFNFFRIFLSNAGNLIGSYTQTGLPIPGNDYFLSAIQYNPSTSRERDLVLSERSNFIARAAGTVYPIGIVSNLTRGTMQVATGDEYTTIPAEVMIDTTAKMIPDENQAETFRTLFGRDNLLAAFAAGEKSVSYRHQHCQANGEIHWVESTAVFVPQPDGELCCVSLVRFIDDEIRQHEVLEKARAAAEAANQAKSRFLFTMSHDIRTPMNAILRYTELLEKYDSDPERRKNYYKNIKTAGGYLLELISGILELSRIESGKETINYEVIDFNEFIDSVAVVFSQDYRRKSLSVERFGSISKRYLVTDAVKCRQIVLNILSNAVKYTPEGGSIRIYFEELPSPDEQHIMVRFIVEDTGIGMSPEFLPHLFDTFVREHSESESKIQGTGLGMGIVKKLVTLMGGSVDAESEHGRGTKIIVTMPFGLADGPELQTPELSFDDIELRGLRVLLAEDNDLNAEIASEFLSEEGVIVDRAENGLVCLQMLTSAEYPYDLVFMDMQMPVMDGCSAAENIRRLSGPVSKTPIIAMTANVFAEDRLRAMRAGMDGFCSKPIDSARMFTEIRRVIKFSGR